MELTTPALLFPAISLLLLAFTNRFLVLAQLIRQLHAQGQDNASLMIHRQIVNLRRRVKLIRWMQIFGVGSFLLCTLSMLSLFIEQQSAGMILFGISVSLLCLSLCFSLYEVHISLGAIDIELEDLDSWVKSRQSASPDESSSTASAE